MKRTNNIWKIHVENCMSPEIILMFTEMCFWKYQKIYQVIGLSMILNVLTIMISRKRLLLVIEIELIMILN